MPSASVLTMTPNLYFVYFDGAAVPAIVTGNPAARPSKTGDLPWTLRDSAGRVLDFYNPAARPGRVFPLPLAA